MPKVFLSAGHGGRDPGAVANGLYEKTINLNTLLECANELTRHGVDVVCSRTTDTDDPVAQEVKEANSSGADVSVSFHVNASGGNGFEVYFYSSNANGEKLASLCEKHVKALGQNSRGIKHGNSLYFIKNTNMTSVLVESFFIDNPVDKKIGDTIEEQKAFGRAYAKAILEYLGITYKNEHAPNSTLYRVQVGAYSSEVNAKNMRAKLEKAGFGAIIVKG
jgi:N-acetylmuramoyl-L-alanine amidase